MRIVQRFLREDCGATSVEYAVVIGFIFAVCLTAVAVFGRSTNKSVQQSSVELSTALQH